MIPLIAGIILFTVFEKNEQKFTNSTHKQTVLDTIKNSSDITNIKLIAIHSELSEEKWKIIALNDLKRYSYILFLLSLLNLAICIYIISVAENISNKSIKKEIPGLNDP